MPNLVTRRRALGALGLATLPWAAPTLARAQAYPERPVRLLHGFAAGGNADAVARILAAALQQQLGQVFNVEPKPGAGGTLAADAAAKSRPDGYTLLLATGGHAIAAALNDKLPFDAVKSFQPISSLTSFPFLVVVPASSPLRNVADLRTRSKAKPLTYGTAGIGTGQHMTGALLSYKAGIESTHVPYRGDAASVTAALGGETDFVVAPASAVVQHIRAGKLRAIAISGRSRWSGLPDVPTVAEQGVADFEVRSWTALLAPAGTPAPVLDRLQGAVRTALADGAVRQKLEEATGGDVGAGTPQELGQVIVADVQRWTDLVREARIQRE
jgi:tripartite-type tricarboxylate transporter receptor subunit TctC